MARWCLPATGKELSVLRWRPPMAGNTNVEEKEVRMAAALAGGRTPPPSLPTSARCRSFLGCAWWSGRASATVVGSGVGSALERELAELRREVEEEKRSLAATEEGPMLMRPEAESVLEAMSVACRRAPPRSTETAREDAYLWMRGWG